MMEELLAIARGAGEEVLRYYGQGGAVQKKADNSPLTLADRAAHTYIAQRLRAFDAEGFLLSEESPEEEVAGRHGWSAFWLVDPLDGTKEFIKQSGEFTINIAKVENGVPVRGVVHAPVLGETWYAEKGQGAWKMAEGQAPQRLRTRAWPGDEPVIVASRDHAGPQVAELFRRYPGAQTASMGSSLKFCLVAEGKADLYLRDVPTMEWDTGAAQIIVEEAGGQVTDLAGKVLSYNKASLRNPFLLTRGDPDFFPPLAGNAEGGS